MKSTTTPGSGDPRLLEVAGLAVEFDVGRHRPPLRAVDGVDISVGSHETLGIVGESGSGKSTLGRAILGLAPIAEGSVSFAGRDISHATERERRRLSAELQVVFQDPYSSLSPTRTIGDTLAEPLRVHQKLGRAALAHKVGSMLERVGLSAEAANRYPAQFSGGQRQRVAIARALMVQPRLVICDEAVSALDLSVQAQVLNLLSELQRELGLSYLFIAHDLSVVRHLSHRLVVLYRGRVMEQGPAGVVHDAPTHPYTQALLDAAPVPDPELQRQRRVARQRSRAETVGTLPPDSCPFATRCEHAIDVCRSARPPLESTPEGTQVACHRWAELRERSAAVTQRRSSLPLSLHEPR